MPQKELDFLDCIAKAIGGRVTIPPNHDVSISAVSGDEFDTMATLIFKGRRSRPEFAMALLPKEESPILTVIVDKDSLAPGAMARRVHFTAEVAHEAVENEFITPPEDIIESARHLRRRVIQRTPGTGDMISDAQIRQILTESHLRGVIAANRTSVELGVFGTARSIFRHKFGPGGTKRGSGIVHERFVAASSLREELKRNRRKNKS